MYCVCVCVFSGMMVFIPDEDPNRALSRNLNSKTKSCLVSCVVEILTYRLRLEALRREIVMISLWNFGLCGMGMWQFLLVRCVSKKPVFTGTCNHVWDEGWGRCFHRNVSHFYLEYIHIVTRHCSIFMCLNCDLMWFSLTVKAGHLLLSVLDQSSRLPRPITFVSCSIDVSRFCERQVLLYGV
jgi:hypothetical protein